MMFDIHKRGKTLLGACLASVMTTFIATATFAQQAGVPNDAPSTRTAASDAPVWVDAEVRRIDTDGRKLTLRHGDIPNLDMPGMTMIFRVKEGVPLDTIKVGDKVRFTAVSENGLFFLTQLRPAE